jgi:F420-0:gamma-glutamyl ligase-like protein
MGQGFIDILVLPLKGCEIQNGKINLIMEKIVVVVAVNEYFPLNNPCWKPASKARFSSAFKSGFGRITPEC